jgi:hypothetical protein
LGHGKDPGPRTDSNITSMRQTTSIDSQPEKAPASQRNTREQESKAASVRKNDIPSLAKDRPCVVLQPNRSAPTPREPYNIIFDCKNAMGFYSLTERKGGPYCKVLSVCPRSNAQTDPRIQTETKILFAEVYGRERKEVSNHGDLRESFLEARNVGEHLRVTFINTNVTDETMDRASRWVAREWTEDGQWQGKCKTGWDGGAFLCQKQPLSNPKLDTFIKSVLPPPNESRVDCISTALRKVRFAPAHKCRTYDVGSLPGEFIENSDSQQMPDTAKRIAPKEKAPLKVRQSEHKAPDVSMLDIRHMSIGDLLRHLESGAMEDDEFVLWLEHIHKQNILKHEVHHKSAELQAAPQDKTLERRLRELNLMSKVLKIAINADVIAKETQSLENWEKFHIIVIAIDGIDLDDATPSIVVEVSVASSIAGHSERLPPLPNRSLSPHIVYDENGPSYNLNHNGMKTDDRFIEFRIHTRDQSDERNRSTFMGNFVVKLSQLSMRCAIDKACQDVFFDAEPENDLLGVKICLRVRRADSLEYIQGKYDEARNRLKNVIDWITRLNDDLKLWNQDHADELNLIGGDLRLNGGSSMLQSAIYLKDNVFLRRLLDLGRGGVNESCLNSAYNLTLRLLALDDTGRQDAENKLDEMCDVLCNLINTPEAEPSKVVGEKAGVDHDALKLPGTADDPSEQQRHAASIDIQISRASMQSVSELPTGLGQASGASDPERCGQLPSLCHSDFVPIDVDRRCRYFDRNHSCANKSCRFIHVHRLTSKDVIVNLHKVKKATRKISATILRLKDTALFHKAHAGGKVWWTAGCRTPTDVFYAAGGPSQLSSDNVSWYRSKAEAIEALSQVLVAALWARANEVVPSSFQSSSSNRRAC